MTGRIFLKFTSKICSVFGEKGFLIIAAHFFPEDIMTRFSPGRVLATPAALQSMNQANIDVTQLLRRHLQGDWGQVSPPDACANNQALRDGSRLLSSYQLNDQQNVWVITEAEDDEGNREATTFLLPSEY